MEPGKGARWAFLVALDLGCCESPLAQLLNGAFHCPSPVPAPPLFPCCVWRCVYADSLSSVVRCLLCLEEPHLDLFPPRGPGLGVDAVPGET